MINLFSTEDINYLKLFAENLTLPDGQLPEAQKKEAAHCHDIIRAIRDRLLKSNAFPSNDLNATFDELETSLDVLDMQDQQRLTARRAAKVIDAFKQAVTTLETLSSSPKEIITDPREVSPRLWFEHCKSNFDSSPKPIRQKITDFFDQLRKGRCIEHLAHVSPALMAELVDFENALESITEPLLESEVHDYFNDISNTLASSKKSDSLSDRVLEKIKDEAASVNGKEQAEQKLSQEQSSALGDLVDFCQKFAAIAAKTEPSIQYADAGTINEPQFRQAKEMLKSQIDRTNNDFIKKELQNILRALDTDAEYSRERQIIDTVIESFETKLSKAQKDGDKEHYKSIIKILKKAETLDQLKEKITFHKIECELKLASSGLEINFSHAYRLAVKKLKYMSTKIHFARQLGFEKEYQPGVYRDQVRTLLKEEGQTILHDSRTQPGAFVATTLVNKALGIYDEALLVPVLRDFPPESLLVRDFAQDSQRIDVRFTPKWQLCQTFAIGNGKESEVYFDSFKEYCEAYHSTAIKYQNFNAKYLAFLKELYEFTRQDGGKGRFIRHVEGFVKEYNLKMRFPNLVNRLDTLCSTACSQPCIHALEKDIYSRESLGRYSHLPFFYENIDQRQAEEMLGDAPGGSFMIRCLPVKEEAAKQVGKGRGPGYLKRTKDNRDAVGSEPIPTTGSTVDTAQDPSIVPEKMAVVERKPEVIIEQVKMFKTVKDEGGNFLHLDFPTLNNVGKIPLCVSPQRQAALVSYNKKMVWYEKMLEAYPRETSGYYDSEPTRLRGPTIREAEQVKFFLNQKLKVVVHITETGYKLENCDTIFDDINKLIAFAREQFVKQEAAGKS